MVLLLETAEVLESRARRTRDVDQVAVLLRCAEHRRREATELRELLASRGAARPVPEARTAAGNTAARKRARSAGSQPTFRPASPPGQRAG